MKFLLFLFCSHVFKIAAATAIIDPHLKQAFETRSPDTTKNVIISFSQRPQVVIQEISSKTFSSIHEKRTALTEAQQEFANNAQGPLQKYLEDRQIPYETFWINNKMHIPNANSKLVNTLSTFPGVTSIDKEIVIKLNPIGVGEPEELKNKSTLEWGILKIRADQVWKSYKGKGVVVAGIDTGVRHTHEALSANWRKSYGWFDAVSGKKDPYDDNGHGTHTIGTIIGGNGIGVAPKASFVACRACSDEGGCPHSFLIRCGQWVQCPFDWQGKNKNCSMAPDIVSNSWGGGQADNFYDGIISSWHAAGIIPIFAMGNAGPFCKTAQSPGDRPNVISVGSINKHNLISPFSSIGPSVDGVMQPLITAPGQDIRSAWHTNDTAYNTISGTSMATPHVSGLAALMHEKVRHLTYEKLFDAIITTTNTKLDDSTAPASCGHLVSSRFPNNVFGYGAIDAVNAVNAIK